MDNYNINEAITKTDKTEVKTYIINSKDLEDKIAELQQAGDGAWEDLKQGLENSWDILKTSFSKAKSEFERGYRKER